LAKSNTGIFHLVLPKETIHFPQSSKLPQAVHDFG